MKKTGKPRKELPPDQQAELEKAFLGGLMTWRAMCVKFGVSNDWLVKEAKRLGWSRDLTPKINQTAQRKEQENIAREAAKSDPQRKLTEREVTESNADLIASVTGSHRASLARVRAIAETLLDELEFAGANKDLLQSLSVELYGNDDRAKANLIASLSSVSGRTTSFKQLVDSIKTIVTTEREVLRIGEPGAGDHDAETVKVIRIPCKAV